jgi:hypothetical protein
MTVAGFRRVSGLPKPGCISMIPARATVFAGRLCAVADKTPYDSDRMKFSKRALARLVLSSKTADLANAAGELAVTVHDAHTGPGARASEAFALTVAAERVLATAVVYERERGSSWVDIAQYLGIDAAEAERRFAPEITHWDSAFEQPYRTDVPGCRRIPQLPAAAYDPVTACRNLDLWAHLLLRFDEQHAVSGGLDDEPHECPRMAEITGYIARDNLGQFISCLTYFVSNEQDHVDWDALCLRVTEDEDPDKWFAHRVDGGQRDHGRHGVGGGPGRQEAGPAAADRHPAGGVLLRKSILDIARPPPTASTVSNRDSRNHGWIRCPDNQ